jgi:hypothetical protein
MNMNLVNDPHILIEMSDAPDCRFVGSWLLKVAEAQTFWSEMENDDQFADLCAACVPNLECAAFAILCESKEQDHASVTALYQDGELDQFAFEFGMMVQLGFFFATDGQSYRIAVPENVTCAGVRQAALTILSTVDDIGDGIEVVQPERLLRTFRRKEAEALRSRLLAIRRFNAHADYGRKIH